MKTFRSFFILILFISIVSCEKDNPVEIYNMDVENYIELLKSNQYDSLNLPEFTFEDIPALLKYRNEKQIITNFPHNPISSLWGPECKLGMYVLWTIESIRAVAINSEYLIMRFPSQNPILALKDAEELTLVNDVKSHEIAAHAYIVWWYNFMHMSTEAFMYSDPLENTNYRWH
ncbi:MAG TPA: DUF4943 family protein [Bacteroidales bacterium]|nr:DUF4943 family protein [Bacteroidales bacterium]